MGVDVIDYTQLIEKGLMKRPAAPKKIAGFDTKEGFVDLSASMPLGALSSVPSIIPQETSVSPLPDNMFDSLVSLAQAGPSVSQSPNVQASAGMDDIGLKLDTMLNKIEDTMYKIETLSSRLAQLEARLSRN